MVKWKYKILKVSDIGDAKQLEQLNNLGEEGWEAFAIISTSAGYPLKIYLKRRTESSKPDIINDAIQEWVREEVRKKNPKSVEGLEIAKKYLRH